MTSAASSAENPPVENASVEVTPVENALLDNSTVETPTLDTVPIEGLPIEGLPIEGPPSQDSTLVERSSGRAIDAEAQPQPDPKAELRSEAEASSEPREDSTPHRRRRTRAPRTAVSAGQSSRWWALLRRIASTASAIGGPRLRSVVVWLLRQVVQAVVVWRKSLQVRVVSSTLVLGLAATSLVGMALAEQVSARLVQARQEQAFKEAQTATNQFVAEMNTYSGANGTPLKTYVRDSLYRLKDTGGESAVGVLLLLQGDQAAADGITAYGTINANIVPQNLRDKVVSTTTQQQRLISLRQANGSTAAGVVVGQQVSLPGSNGGYELYFVMSLQPEQDTLDSIQRVLAAGMLSLVLMLGVIAWLVSRQVVSPLKEAAQVAERLSHGSLDERMSPHGHDEIARLARSFNDMADTLQDKIEDMAELSRLQRRFVSDVSHELRTPLTTIRMAAEVISASSDGFPPPVARSSELLSTQLDRFEALLADLLEISRFDAGAAALEASEVELGGIVRRVVELAAPLAEAKHTVVDVHLLQSAALAEVDSRRVERIVRNLVVNAIEHCEAKPVEVWVATDERTACILVVDHGIGLRPGDAERVFDRFWRADPARARTTGGTGLGLAISLEDAYLHGGSLRAWGLPGIGSRFLLVLPRTAGAVPGRSPLPLAAPGHDDEPEESSASVDPEEEWLLSQLAIDKLVEPSPKRGPEGTP